MPVEVPLEELAVEPVHPEVLISFLKGMEFATLMRRVVAAHGVQDVEDIDAKPLARGAAPISAGRRPRSRR